ncbi:MAG: hypothetical protein GXO27_04585 [Chlorobi bacterium]|nr:hypothetical protein [Chlorobiota bacterium]
MNKRMLFGMFGEHKFLRFFGFMLVWWAVAAVSPLEAQDLGDELLDFIRTRREMELQRLNDSMFIYLEEKAVGPWVSYVFDDYYRCVIKSWIFENPAAFLLFQLKMKSGARVGDDGSWVKDGILYYTDTTYVGWNTYYAVVAVDLRTFPDEAFRQIWKRLTLRME